MKDVTKRNFKNSLILWFFMLTICLIVTVLYIGEGEFLLSIPLALVSIFILILIGVCFKMYFNYKQNTNVLEGTITNVFSYKSYQIVIKSDEKYYTARYKFISSHIRDKIGNRCTFVIDKKGKAYIKDIE